MLSKPLSIQPETIIECTVIKPTRRLSSLVTGLSTRRISLLSSTSNQTSKGKKRVRFGSTTVQEEYEYPSAASMAPKSDIWYCMPELLDSLREEVDNHHLNRSNSNGSNSSDKEAPHMETRGLETYLEDQTHRRHSVKHYVRMIILKSQQARENASSKRFPLSSINSRGSDNGVGSNSSVTRYSYQFTACAKDVAFRQAIDDELVARRIYLESGTVQSSVDFATKSADCHSELFQAKVSMRAVATAKGPRKSFTAQSA